MFAPCRGSKTGASWLGALSEPYRSRCEPHDVPWLHIAVAVLFSGASANELDTVSRSGVCDSQCALLNNKLEVGIMRHCKVADPCAGVAQ